jgi:hypothetical protein
MESYISLSCSEEPASGVSSEVHVFCSHPHLLCLKSVLIFFLPFTFTFSSSLFHLGFVNDAYNVLSLS